MTDVIAQAKKITEAEQYSPPWEFVESAENQYGDWDDSRLVSSNGADIAYDVEDTFGNVLASIPELAEALASEKYVWSVQVLMGGRWIFMVTLNTGNSLEEAAKWFPTRERAEYFASLWEPETPARVVKRRVSPVVVDG